jgi:hypothetical protein
MCDAAYLVMKTSVILSILSLAAAAFYWLLSEGLTVDTYYYYHMARELTNLPFALLLLGVILSVCFEERFQGVSL